MKVLIHADCPEAFIDVIRDRHPGLELDCCRDYAGLPDALTRIAPEVMYGIRFAGTPGYPRHAILGTPSLRWVSVGGSGTDHLAPWDPARITVTNAAGVAAALMAQCGKSLGSRRH